MTELASKADVTSADENKSFSKGFDPDSRAAERTVDKGASSVERESHKIDPDARAVQSVAFKGLTHVEPIADKQKAGTCWAESLENVIQLVKGDKKGDLNCLSERIIDMITANPEDWDAQETVDPSHPLERWNIYPHYYPKVLEKFGVEAKNVPFTHEMLQSALEENRPVILYGNVKHIDKYIRDGYRGPHALVAVDWEPDTGRYVLLDSNFKNVYKVSPEELKKFSDDQYVNTPIGWLFRFFVGGNMTVVQTKTQWPDWRTFVDGKWRMYVNNVEVKDPFSVFDDFVKRRS